MLNLQPDLSGNPFLLVLKFNLTEISSKKDWERKAEIAAIIIILFNIKIYNFIGLYPMLVYIATLWLVGLLNIKIHNHFF